MIDQESLENLKANLALIWQEFERDIIDAIKQLVEAVQPLVDEFERIFASIELRNKLKCSWKIEKSIKTPVLFLDKRKKVHRCRNNC